MIHGIGTDIVSVSRFSEVLRKHGNAFIEKYFTLSEIEEGSLALDDSVRTRYYSSRFAAKEAMAKAIGTGFRHGITPISIEIHSDDSGKPFVSLHGDANRHVIEIARSYGKHRYECLLSIAHERYYAVAYAMLLLS